MSAAPLYILSLEIDTKISPSANRLVIPYVPVTFPQRRAVNMYGEIVDLFERFELRRARYFDGTKVVRRWVLEEWPAGIPTTESIYSILKRVGLL